MKQRAHHRTRTARLSTDSPVRDVRTLSFPRWTWQTVLSGIIISVLLFILVNFYLFASIISVNSFLFVFLILTVLTDGLFLLLQIIRRKPTMSRPVLDPSKVTALIACYNGADVIGETIRHLQRHLPPENILVVSDASTDETEEIARSMGARVIRNDENLNKAFSVSVGVHYVRTPYVLLLDDDVLIGKTTIPTNWLDEGYSAVAFDVMPIKTDTFVNTLQQFEYRNSMQIGKNLRAGANAIGNVSGAIGLYRTADLQQQADLHSGQFAGEDEQRTLLTHIYSQGKGIAFSTETVYTHVPNTFHALYRQRAYSWNVSIPEQLMLYFRILFSPYYHYLLKTEKAYYIYIYLTDPLRLLFLWTLLLRPRYLVLTYGVYFVMNTLAWMRTGRKDHFLTVLVYPFYTLWLSLCRFIGNFYWLKVKSAFFRKRFHHLVEGRMLVTEFAAVASIFTLAWAISAMHFTSDLRLFNKIRSSRLEERAQSFQYDTDTSNRLTKLDTLNLTAARVPPQPGTYIQVEVEKGDTLRAIAHKAVNSYVSIHPEKAVPYEQRASINNRVARNIQEGSVYFSASTSRLMIDNSVLEKVFMP